MGYDYDKYELPPKPHTLTTQEAAERERVYHKFHNQALGATGGEAHAPASKGKQE